MIEDRNRRAPPEPTATLGQRLRGWLGLPSEAPLPRPRPFRIEPLRRPRLAAFWQARTSVLARIPLDDFLRSRLARYLAVLPVPQGRLPLRVELNGGELVVRPVEPERRSAPVQEDPTPAWLLPLIAAEGPVVRQEAAELEVRLAVLDGEADAARRRTEELQRKLATDVAAGRVAAPPTLEATAEQLGRPPVRNAATHLSLVAFACAAVLAETWQLAVPLMRVAGLNPVRLGAELAARPAELVLAAVFALGVAVGLFALAHAGLQAATDFGQEVADPRRRRWLALAASLAAVLAAAVASAAAALPAHDPPMPSWTFVFLLLAVPLGTVLVLRRARREREKCEADAAAALAWDRDRARVLTDRARRLEELEWCEAEEIDLERQRAVTRQRFREIAQRAMAAARLAEEAERRERAALARLAQSLVGALELDRYEFMRQAAARGAAELLDAHHGGPEPFPPRIDPATTAAAAEAARLVS